MQNDVLKQYLRGVKAGIPIGLGYVSVSFSFGILAVAMGFLPWQAILISMVTVTSAGQLSGIHTMASPGHYMSMLISQCTINVRYSFMSVSLSQRVDSKFSKLWRAILGFFMTDEIFAVANTEKEVSRSYFLGLSTLPYVGWALGTTFGALLGNVLPEIVMNALCIAIYAMFVAIVIPTAKNEKPLLLVVLCATVLSAVFYYAPYLKALPSGLSISICAVACAVFGALLFPIKEEGGDER